MGYPVQLENPSTRAKIGVRNGGIKVSNEYEPSRDLFLSWGFGNDSTYETLSVSSANNSLSLDLGLLNPTNRQIVIMCQDATPDYAYSVQFSRDGVNDWYTVKSSAAGAKSQVNPVQLLPTDGYDLYVKVVITPTAGQTGNQLKFKQYLVGRGG